MGRRTLTAADKSRVVKALPDDLVRYLKASRGRLFVCGGFIRDVALGDEPKDIDVFGTDGELVKTSGLALGAERPEGSKSTVYSISIKNPDLPIQFVWTWPVASPKVAIDRMDFTMCQAAMWWASGQWRSLCSSEFYPDTDEKRLRYTWPSREGTAGRSLVRAMRFVERGWKFPADEITRLVAHTALEVTEPKVAEAGLNGEHRDAYCDRFRRNVCGIYPIGVERQVPVQA